MSGGGVALPAGTVLGGDFVIVRPLSAGGMGAVFVATQRSTGRTRAIKVMRPELAFVPGLRERFDREARVGAQIDSSHVVEVLAAGLDPIPWIAMELLDGEDLGSVLVRRGSLPAEEVLAIYEQLCHALGAAHDKHIVHRDLKPENIFLARSTFVGMPFVIKVLDFGIAKLTDSIASGAKNTGVIGSRPWMAPEQLDVGTHISARTDVWSLGLIAFALLTGVAYWRTPFDQGMALTIEIASAPLVPASARAREHGVERMLPPDFDDWFAHCVVRDPARRFGDARAAFAALRGVLAPRRPAPVPTIPMAPAPPPSVPSSSGTRAIPAPSEEARRTRMDQSLSSRGEWERLYVDYVDVERARGRKPTTFDAFRRMLSELARTVIAKHGCRMVDIAIVEQDGRPHMKIDPVFDADVE